MGAFGQWGNGPIQFNSNSGVIESRGTMDAPPSAAAGPQTQPPAPSTGTSLPGDGKSLPTGPQTQPTDGGVLPMGGASNNGGEYGMDGGGLSTSSSYGGSSGGSSGGSMSAYDGGGEVPDDAEQDGVGTQQGAQAATLDPMMAIQRTLAYGRKKMGMPANFTQGPGSEQSFDDGGEVDTGEETSGSGVIQPQTPQGAQPGGGMPNPQHTLMYLTGAGNVSPDIADALEKKLDPQGQMDASTRTLHAIASAPSPDAAFGLMQHYRTRYNAYAGGARAALDQGNAGQAAAHATQAFQNIPTGYDVRFAPAQGGIAMSAKKLGPQQSAQPAMEDGGEVGAFDRLGDDHLSDNVEDRREEGVTSKTGTLPETDANNQRRALGDAQQKESGPVDEGVVRKSKMKVVSYDDGGEVDEDEGDGGVIPTQTTNEPPDPSMDQPAQAEPEQDWGQPNVLTPDQFKKVVTAGYDKPLDDGFSKFMSSILQAMNPVGSAQAAQPRGVGMYGQPSTPSNDQSQGVPLPAPRPDGAPGGPDDNGALGNVLGPASRGDFAGAGNNIVGNIKSLFTKPGEAAPDVTAAVTDPAQTPAGQAGPTPNQQPPGGQRWQPTPSIMADAARGMQESTAGKSSKATPPPQAQQAQGQPQQPQGRPRENLDQLYEKYDALWNKMHNGFVSAAEEPQRREFIKGMISKELNTQGAMDIENNKGRLQMQQSRDQNRMLTEQFKQTQINSRNQNTTQSREKIADLNRQWNTWSKQQQDMVRMTGQQLAADPALASDPNKLMSRVTGLAQQMGINPQDMMTLIQNGGPPQQQGAQPGAQPQGQSAQPQGAQTVVVFPRGPYAGKPMIKLPNGTYVPAGQ